MSRVFKLSPYKPRCLVALWGRVRIKISTLAVTGFFSFVFWLAFLTAQH